MNHERGADYTIEDYSLLIRESHIDSYGHVNNATYLSLFEEARWEIITPRGYGFEDVHKLRQGPVIIEVSLKFKKEVNLREKVTIRTQILNYSGKIGQMRQEMLKENGTLACEAIFTFGLFDMKERKLIEPTAKWKKALGVA